MTLDLRQYREVHLVDFEFCAPPGEPPHPICMVSIEYHSGRTRRIWEDELLASTSPPFDTGEDSLLVAYYASAEIGCFLSLGWGPPANILDLYTEFRCHTNGRMDVGNSGLLGALRYFGLPAIDVAEKDSMRDLAMRGGPWTEKEKLDLLDYCESDVVALKHLLPAMQDAIDLPRALLRGRYMAASAQIERNGVPIDTISLNRFKTRWAGIQTRLVTEIDQQYGVYEGTTFKMDRWEQYLMERGMAWPRLLTGRLDMSDDTFKDMVKRYPDLNPLRELRSTLSQMRLAGLEIGSDGRNRVMLSAFRARTGRNQPSNAKFIFGPAVWMRGLIQSQPGYGVAYIDWSQQEFGIAAALSGDELMMDAYRSGDPYLEFAKQAGAAPPDATKKSHGEVRNLFKACVLAVQYGMGSESLALRIGCPKAVAKELLDLHKRTYKKYWRWSEAALDYAMLHGSLHTVFGWKVHTSSNANPRSLQNFPMQANGSEMLRLACILGIERGIKICAPVHDALLIEAPLSVFDAEVQAMQEVMAEASRILLDGFELRSGVEAFPYPERYMDERGAAMWSLVDKVCAELEANAAPCVHAT